MAASICDVFSFCVGVAGPARVAVEVRFVSSAKVRPRRTVPRSATLPGLGDSPAGPHACSLEAPLPLGHCCPAPAGAARGLRVGPRVQAFRAITRWAGAHGVFVRAPSSHGTGPFYQLGWGAPGRGILLLDPGSCWAGREGSCGTKKRGPSRNFLSEIWVGGLRREARTLHKGSWSAKEFEPKPVVTLKGLNQKDDILCFTVVF